MIWLGVLLILSGAALILLRPLLDRGDTALAPTLRQPLADRILRHRTKLLATGSVLAITLVIFLAARSDWNAKTGKDTAPQNLPALSSNQPQLPDVDTMVQRLADRLKSEPGDVRGWKMLGWSYLHLDRPVDAMNAYEKAASLEPGDAETQSSLAEAMIRVEGGKVPEKAHNAIRLALKAEPGNPRATFLLGQWHVQSGKPREAWKLWSDLKTGGLVPEEWRPELDRELSKLAPAVGETPPATASNIPATLPSFSETPSRRGPDAAAIEAAREIPPEERARMIDGMVSGLAERLKSNPKDLDGWLMLARSRMVMGDRNAARTAINRAREEFAGNADAQARITSHAMEIGLAP